MVADLMQGDRYMLLCYGLFMASRLRGVNRRWQQPHLRGPERFLDVAVPSDFYEGPGRAILRSYRQRIFLPFLLDIPVLAWAYSNGSVTPLLWLIVVLVPLIHINHMMNVESAQRRARAFAPQQEAQPVVAMGLSLTPRRLRDLSNPIVEWTLAIATLAALAALVYIGKSGADRHSSPHSIAQLFWVPALYLYLNIGILLAKRIIVHWRTRLPLAHRAEYQKVQDAMRSYYLLMCDWNRIVFTAGICFWPIALTLSEARFKPLMTVWVWGVMVLSIAGSVWIEVLRKRLLRIGLAVEPVRMPDLMDEASLAKWPVCYQPSAPTLILKGARGYSLNLANTTSYLGSVYLLGMIALFTMARLIH
jgi:hypothetical protein